MDSASAKESAGALGRWLEQWTNHVCQVGASCALGGDEAWDRVLNDLAVRRLSADERRRHVSEGPKRLRGALPIEFRWVMDAIHDHVRKEARILDRAIDGSDPVLESIERRLNTLVDEMVRNHVAAISPPVTTSNIFANAMATTPNYNALGVGASMNVMKCTTCRAPRQQDGEPRPCPYCGGTLA